MTDLHIFCNSRFKKSSLGMFLQDPHFYLSVWNANTHPIDGSEDATAGVVIL